MNHFSPLYQLQLPISQNRPVQLVPCFVGVHHILLHVMKAKKKKKKMISGTQITTYIKLELCLKRVAKFANP